MRGDLDIYMRTKYQAVNWLKNDYGCASCYRMNRKSVRSKLTTNVFIFYRILRPINISSGTRIPQVLSVYIILLTCVRGVDLHTTRRATKLSCVRFTCNVCKMTRLIKPLSLTRGKRLERFNYQAAHDSARF